MKQNGIRGRWTGLGAAALLLVAVSCGGGGGGSEPVQSAADPALSQDICQCVPTGTPSSDFRHVQKHVVLPDAPPQDITVATILSWGAPPDPPPDAPRTGRETQMFRVQKAWAWFVWLVGSDCDIHVEIADTPDPNAPRVIVETPIDGSYCVARQSLQQQLAAHGITIGMKGVDLQTPLPVEVIGLAFQDYNHARGTAHVGGPWELHPALVKVLD